MHIEITNEHFYSLQGEIETRSMFYEIWVNSNFRLFNNKIGVEIAKSKIY